MKANLNTITKQEWVIIPEFNGTFAVSNLGNIKSFKRDKVKGEILKPYTNTSGYLQIDFRYNGQRFTPLVHRLVIENFVGTIPNGMQINHKNGIKTDNCLENLEVCTAKENIQHAVSTGLMGMSMENKKNIRDLYYTGMYTQKEVGKIYGITQSYVSYIIRTLNKLNYNIAA